MHKSMAMTDRVENALAGYVLLDLFKLLSTKECRLRGLPVGSCWMAAQTHRNMQYVVMGFISAVLAKDPVGDPFKASHHRWTELPIEMWFGRLRQRAPGAQFNSKQYWAQSAAEMMRQQRLGVGPSDSSILRPPTDQEFKDASVRAVKSAVHLASWCAGVTECSLHQAYFESAPGRTEAFVGLISAADANEPMNEWERDPQEDWENEAEEDDAEGNTKRQWCELLQHVRDEAAASLRAEEENNEEQREDREDDRQPAEPPAVDEWQTVVSMPDGLDLKDVCEATDEGEDADSGSPSTKLLCNLRQALRAAADTSSIETFDKLWRLLMYLRYWHGGMDQHWVSNPRACRRKSATMHWYRWNQMKLAELRREMEDSSASRQRSGRLDKWRELTTAAAARNNAQSGNIVALVVPKRSYNKTVRSLIVAYVTSVWKSNKKPKLVTTSVPLSHVVAFRCTEMTAMDRNVASWQVKEDSTPWVLKPETLLAVLAPSNVEDAVNLGTDSMSVQLSGESVGILDSLQRAPDWWPVLPEDGGDGEDEECQNKAVAGLFVTARRKRKRLSGAKNHAQDARAVNPGNADKSMNKKRKDKKEKKDKKESKKNLLKKVRKEKQIPFDPKYFRRNGMGPVIVVQTMVKMKCLEEETFATKGAPCFDVDGKCMIKHKACENIIWDDVVNHAHSFFCAE
eukprot:s131_g40.t1